MPKFSAFPWAPLLLLFCALPNTSANSPHLPRIHGWLLNAVKQSLLQVEQNACGSEQKHPCGGRDLSNAAVSTYLVSSLATKGTDINTTGAMHWLSQVQPGGSFVGQGFCALAQEDAFMASVNDTSAQWIVASINKALPGLASNIGMSWEIKQRILRDCCRIVSERNCAQTEFGVSSCSGASLRQFQFVLKMIWIIDISHTGALWGATTGKIEET